MTGYREEDTAIIPFLCLLMKVGDGLSFVN